MKNLSEVLLDSWSFYLVESIPNGKIIAIIIGEKKLNPL